MFCITKLNKNTLSIDGPLNNIEGRGPFSKQLVPHFFFFFNLKSTFKINRLF